jgi:hypothetical protein
VISGARQWELVEVRGGWCFDQKLGVSRWELGDRRCAREGVGWEMGDGRWDMGEGLLTFGLWLWGYCLSDWGD